MRTVTFLSVPDAIVTTTYYLLYACIILCTHIIHDRNDLTACDNIPPRSDCGGVRCDDSADIARDSVPENRRTQFKIMASNKRTCAREYV